MIENKNWIELPTDQLVKADWNYKVDDDERAAKLEANIKRNGQVENILVREMDDDRYEVINGNHRLTVFKGLGFTTVVCFNFGNITDVQARRIAVETNETKFATDNIKLAGLFTDILGEGGFEIDEIVKTVPFSIDELTGFTQLADFDWSQFVDPDPGGDGTDPNPDPAPVRCPHCNKEFVPK